MDRNRIPFDAAVGRHRVNRVNSRDYLPESVESAGEYFYFPFVWVAFDARKQAWHDKMARTVVIYRR